MSAELSNLSTLYSAKCLENSQLDEKIKFLMEQEKAKWLVDRWCQESKKKLFSELEVENGRLKRDLQHKDDQYAQLRKRLDYLEQTLKDTTKTRGRQTF